MNLKLNGTGASEGFPSIFCECQYCQEARRLGGKNIRHRTSSCIDHKILIDFSADTYASCLQHSIDLSKIHHLIVTHSHADHFFATDFHYLLPPFCSASHKFTIYGNAAVHRKFIEEHKNNPELLRHVAFSELSSGTSFFIEDYEITPIPALHDSKEECFMYAIKKEQRELLYAHDSTLFPDAAWKYLEGHRFSLVVLDCTSLEEGNYFPNHMGLPENKKIMEQMYHNQTAGPDTRFVITHFAHTFNPLHDRVVRLAEKHGFIAAYDGISLDV